MVICTLEVPNIILLTELCQEIEKLSSNITPRPLILKGFLDSLFAYKMGMQLHINYYNRMNGDSYLVSKAIHLPVPRAIRTWTPGQQQQI